MINVQRKRERTRDEERAHERQKRVGETKKQVSVSSDEHERNNKYN